MLVADREMLGSVKKAPSGQTSVVDGVRIAYMSINQLLRKRTEYVYLMPFGNSWQVVHGGRNGAGTSDPRLIFDCFDEALETFKSKAIDGDLENLEVHLRMLGWR